MDVYRLSFLCGALLQACFVLGKLLSAKAPEREKISCAAHLLYYAALTGALLVMLAAAYYRDPVLLLGQFFALGLYIKLTQK